MGNDLKTKFDNFVLRFKTDKKFRKTTIVGLVAVLILLGIIFGSGSVPVE